MVSVIMFLAAIVLFMSLFNQTIQTAVVYQQHSALSTKTSDLLDNMLLSSGNPVGWSLQSINSSSPTGFGLQDEDFAQYQLSPFALMRLESTSTPVRYEMDGQNITYSNINMGFGQSILVPYSEVLNYSSASKLMGINGSYSFSLALSPTINVAISTLQSQPSSTLSLNVSVSGPGFPLAGAKVAYCLITVTGRDYPNKPVYNVYNGNALTDAAGNATVRTGVDVTQKSYALIASASLSGLSGVGYYSNSLCNSTYVVPLVSNVEACTIDLAHSWDIWRKTADDWEHAGDPGNLLYNTTFLRASDMTEMPLDNGTGVAGVYGMLNVAQIPTHSYDTLTLDSNNLGILVVAYSLNASASGVVVMPWGFSPLGFSVTFGANPGEQDWISTDLRQVLINNVPYQAKLSLWSNAGHQVIT